MNLFVNELALHGQFEGIAHFRTSLKELLACRKCVNEFAYSLYVLQSIGERPTIREISFRSAVQQIGDINITRSVMRWIDFERPSADDVFVHSPNEYYAYGEEVVTGSVLGEVAARYFAGQHTALVSFAPSAFEQTPITVCWHQSDNHVDECELDNHWSIATLKPYLETHQEAPTSWPVLLDQVRGRYTNLTFADTLLDYLVGVPFSAAIASRVFELLRILDRLKVCFDDKGQRTLEGENLVDNFFRRENALFTDASETEKHDAIFREAMTFRRETGERIECFWHGKIRTREFRIHFSYPIEKDAPLYIAYIGPKLTRR